MSVSYLPHYVKNTMKLVKLTETMCIKHKSAILAVRSRAHLKASCFSLRCMSATCLLHSLKTFVSMCQPVSHFGLMSRSHLKVNILRLRFTLNISTTF